MRGDNQSQEELEDIQLGMDIMQNPGGYHANHQSQPLSVLGQSGELTAPKPRIGQSQQQMGQKIVGEKGKSSKINNYFVEISDLRQFKTNPNILGANDDDDSQYPTASKDQFMGKRNTVQNISAPAAGRKPKANTINVDELQGATLGHNTQPNTATF